MESNSSAPRQLKLNYKRTFIIGFAFFGILLWCQIYDTWCPTFLTQLFCETFGYNTPELIAQHNQEVQYLVGIMMALDNIAALILLPVFGRISDKTNTKIGKRMPFIIIGTAVCAIAFPFIPVFFHYHNLVGVIVFMAICVCFAMMYRNPAVALMPDLTPKPLRSKANGIINIMGYFGGAFATVVGLVFVLTNYLGTGKKGTDTWAYHNIWAVEGPFLVGSVLMIISCIFLVLKIKENKIREEIREDMEEGERQSEVEGVSEDDNAPMLKSHKVMLWLILIAEFFWFMADNGISTFFTNYVIYGLHCESYSALIATIVGGVASVAGFAFGGAVASKIGRKWTVVGGLGLAVIAYVIWAICTKTVPIKEGSTSLPAYIYVVWAIKGLGMSFVHVNSLPMVVELCNSKKVGTFTGFYYASSMSAQTITPCLLGLFLLSDQLDWSFLPVYALALVGAALVVFLFVKSVKSKKTSFKVGIEAIGDDD